MSSDFVWITVLSLTSCLGPLLALTCVRNHASGSDRGGERPRGRAEAMFFLVFFLVAAGTLLAVMAQQSSWIMGGVVLAGMVIGGTLPADSRSGRVHHSQNPF